MIMSETTELMTIDQLWDNFSIQYAEKRQEYELEKTRIENVDMTSSKLGRIDLADLNKLREDCVKLEGALEAIILVRKNVLGMETSSDEES
jgi:hypothetical protein